MTVGMTTRSVSAMWWRRVNSQQIDEWGLVHQKGEPSGTKVIGKYNWWTEWNVIQDDD